MEQKQQRKFSESSLNSNGNSAFFSENSEKKQIPLKAHKTPKYTLADLQGDFITTETEIKPLEPLMKIGNEQSIFSAKGEISLITGQPKAGKTTIIGFMIGTALMPNIPDSLDSLQIKSTYCQGKKIVFIDTEQPKFQTQNLSKQICKIVGIETLPTNVILCNLSQYSRKERRERIESLLYNLEDINLLFVDGIADLINNVNDITEVNEVFDYFSIKAKELEIGIVFCLHENPSSDKMRGHLGSEAERKCAGTIALKKDRTNKVLSIQARLFRYSGDFENINFKYNKELGRMASLDPSEIKELAIDKKEVKIKELKALAEKIIVGNLPVEHKTLLQRLQSPTFFINGKHYTNESTAKSRVKEMTNLGIIIKNEEGRYQLEKSNTF